MKSVPSWTRGYRDLPIGPVTVQLPYVSRKLSCRHCGHWKETAHMQLNMTTGYRGICCANCHRQARVSLHHCQCETIWHRCPTHRHDPPVHRSEKPVEQDNAAKPKDIKVRLSLHRMAPEATTRKPTKRRKLEGVCSEHRLHSHGMVTGSGTTVAPQLNASLHPQLAAKFPHLVTRRGDACAEYVCGAVVF